MCCRDWLSCRNCTKSMPFLPSSPEFLACSVPPFSLDNWGYCWHCGNRLSCRSRRNCRCGLLPERALPLVVSLPTTIVAAVPGWCCSGSALSPCASDLLLDPFRTLVYLLYEPVSALLEVHQGLLLQVVK